LTSVTARKVTSSAKWSGYNTLLGIAILLIRTYILVRILTPEDFGVVALALLLLTTIKQFSQTGLEQALVQDDECSKKSINTVWTTSIIRGAIFFLLLGALNPFYVDFFDEKDISSVLFIVSFAVLINGFKNTYLIIQQKNLEFRNHFRVSISSQIVDFLVTVCLAVLVDDFGLYALSLGYVSASLVASILSFVLLENKPSLSFDLYSFKRLFGFGKWVLGGGVVIFLILNIDTAVIGKIFGVAMLGYYKIAYRFANLLATDFVLNVSKFLYPLFSSVKNNSENLKEYFLFSLLVVSVLVLPVMTILGLFAESFVAGYLGDGWSDVVEPLQILVIFGTVRSYAAICGYVFWAKGQSKIPALISTAQLLLVALIIVPLAIEFQITGVAISVTVPLVVSAVVSWYMVGKLVAIRLKEYAEFMYPCVLSWVLMVASILVFQSIYKNTLNFPELILVSILFTLLYILLVLLFDLSKNAKILQVVRAIDRGGKCKGRGS